MLRQVLVFVCVFGGGSVWGASPKLTTIQPRGAKQGSELTLTFTGTNLGDTQEVLTYGPGLTIQTLEVVSPTQVQVQVRVAADCRPGEHALRLRTATGISDLRSFWVGFLPTVDEVEPNNDFEKPQAIALNTTIHGSIGAEDQDFFVVECQKGQRLSVEIEGMRLGGGMFDPYIAILDAKRFELATSDDHPRLGQDGACAIQVPEDGRYIIQVRESAYGNGNQYRLHVGTFPLPAAVIPAGGRPGERVEVRFVGDPLGEIKQTVQLPAEADPNYRLFCQTAEGVSPTGFAFRVVDLPNTQGTEANLSHATAIPGPVPGAFNGVVDTPRASKVFRFSAKKGETFDVQCYARRIGSPLDSVLHVGLADGSKLLVSNDDAGGPDSALTFTAPDDGDYAVWVHDHLVQAGPTYVFRIEMTPVRPSVRLTIPKVDVNNPQNQDRQTIAVPKGNRFAALVNVARKEVSGLLTLGWTPLLPGLKVTAEPADPGQTAIPVVFEASDTAEIGGQFGAFTAVDPKGEPAPARTVSDTVLCVGQNQTVYHRIEADRVAAAVIEPVPFRIEVMEPKAPVVQNGSLNLKVTATRSADFQGPITIIPLWTPPGMGIQGSATIPQGSTEAILTMNAAGNAATRKWKTALLAQAETATGPVWVSSQLFTVEVAPPPVTVAITRAAVEQGKPVEVVCQVTVNSPFEGEATVKLLGLPAKAAAPDLKLTPDSKELTFPVTTEPATPAGKHKLFCQVLLTVHGEQVTQNTGDAELRVDAPLPAKPTTTAKSTDSNPTPPTKRVSRLEQLRQEQQAKQQSGQP